MHKILQDLKNDLSQGYIEDTSKIMHRDWTLRTLNEGEEIWRDGYSQFGMSSAALSTKRLATLAIAIKAIDGVPVEELFPVSPQPEGEAASESEIEKRILDSLVRTDVGVTKFRAAEGMRVFLSEECTQPELLIELYRFYLSLEKRRQEVLGELKKSSGRMSPVISQEPPSE